MSAGKWTNSRGPARRWAHFLEERVICAERNLKKSGISGAPILRRYDVQRAGYLCFTKAMEVLTGGAETLYSRSFGPAPLRITCCFLESGKASHSGRSFAQMFVVSPLDCLPPRSPTVACVQFPKEQEKCRCFHRTTGSWVCFPPVQGMLVRSVSQFT